MNRRWIIAACMAMAAPLAHADASAFEGAANPTGFGALVPPPVPPAGVKPISPLGNQAASPFVPPPPAPNFDHGPTVNGVSLTHPSAPPPQPTSPAKFPMRNLFKSGQVPSGGGFGAQTPGFASVNTTTPAPPPLTAGQQARVEAASMASGLPSQSPSGMTFAEADKGGVQVDGDTIDAAPLTTYRVTLSGVAPNVLVSPFPNPRLITTNPTEVKYLAHGHDLVVTVTTGGPVGVYVTDADPHAPMIALTLVPKAIPPRTYRLKVPDFRPPTAHPLARQSSQYNQSLVDLLRSVVLGRVPSRFQHSDDLPAGQTLDGLQIMPLKAWRSADQEIDEYAATNRGASASALSENDFYSKGVQAVVIYPVSNIPAGQSSRVYIVKHLAHNGQGLGGVW